MPPRAATPKTDAAPEILGGGRVVLLAVDLEDAQAYARSFSGVDGARWKSPADPFPEGLIVEAVHATAEARRHPDYQAALYRYRRSALVTRQRPASRPAV